MLELRRPAPIRRHHGPVIRPRLIPVRAQTDHRLDGKAHTRLRHADGFVLGVMGHVGRAVEQLPDAVPAVGADDGAFLGFGVLFDRVAGFAEGHAGLHELDGFGQALAGAFDDADGGGVRERFGAHVVGFVQVGVEAAVVEGDVEVEDVAVEQQPVVGDAVANDFVGGGAEGFGEAVVV